VERDRGGRPLVYLYTEDGRRIPNRAHLSRKQSLPFKTDSRANASAHCPTSRSNGPRARVARPWPLSVPLN
jgi:hypothetical protein